MDLIKRLYLALIILLMSLSGWAQDYYVVIGTFDAERNARIFTGYARSVHYDAQYFLHPKTKRYYVYVLKTEDRKEASELAIQLQRESEFTDAWMFTDATGAGREPKTPIAESKPEIIADKKIEPPPAPVVVETTQVVKDPEPKVEPAEAVVEKQEIPEVADAVADPEKSKPRGRLFRFVANTSDGREVMGNIYSVNKLQRRDIATYKVNSTVDILKPNNPALFLSCEIFGYNDVVKIIDYNNPAGTEDVYLDDDGTWIVSFELEPMKKGDVSMMNNVTFYKDAVIMLPNSKDELDELVNMMKSNPNYRIKIHGHNNGNEKNIRITTLGSDRNYFSMARSMSHIGTGKELSRLRAETIQQYLADHGIDKKRTEIYAWGGMEMLLPQGSAAAARINNRIEIEILQD